MRKLIYGIVTAIFSLVLVFSGGELLVRLLVPAETFWPLHSDIYRTVDNAVRYTHKPDLQRPAFGVGLRTNSAGFRGPGWPLRKPAGVYRIALIGDSHAFGFGVAFEHSVGEVLADLLNQNSNRRHEVLNFAANGYNSNQQLAVLRCYALAYQPDLILVIASSNDHEAPLFVDPFGWLHSSEREAQQKRHPGGLSRWQRHSRLVLYASLWHRRLQARRTEQRLASAEPVAEGAWWMGPFPPGPVSERLQTTVFQPLATMVEEAKRRSIPIIIANFNGFLDYRQMFQQLGKTLQVPTLELLALFPEAKDWPQLQRLFSLGWDSHLNAAAHARWARALVPLIRQQQAVYGSIL